MFDQYGDVKGSVKSGKRDRRGLWMWAEAEDCGRANLNYTEIGKKYLLARAFVHVNKFPGNV